MEEHGIYNCINKELKLYEKLLQGDLETFAIIEDLILKALKDELSKTEELPVIAAMHLIQTIVKALENDGTIATKEDNIVLTFMVGHSIAFDKKEGRMVFNQYTPEAWLHILKIYKDTLSEGMKDLECIII